MTAAPIPPNETTRLGELAALDILDTAPERAFDDLTLLAADLFATPIALIGLVGASRQWFKSRIGLPAREIPREHAFCAHAILGDKPLVVTNALEDPRFADNPLVVGAPGIRFYAGAPLALPSGARVGTLCVIDTQPRHFSDVQLMNLERLSGLVATLLELRRLAVEQRIAHDRLRDEIRERDATVAALRSGELRFRTLLDKAPLPAALARDGRFLYANDRLAEMLGIEDAAALIGTESLDRIAPSCRKQWLGRRERRRKRQPVLTEFETIALRADGSEAAVAAHVDSIELADGPATLGFFRDVTASTRISAMLEFLAQKGWARQGRDFFPSLVEHIGRLSGVAYVIVDQIGNDPQLAETVALYARGSIAPNLRYSLAGTPCDNVMGKSLCHYSHGIQRLFPQDRLLVDMQAESYVGLPLWDSKGQPLGLIAVMDDKPMPDSEPIATLLQLAATRAAAELERGRVEAELARVSAYNRSLIDANADALVVFNLEGDITDLNATAEEMTGRARAALLDSAFANIFTAPAKARTAGMRVLSGLPLRNLELRVRHARREAVPVTLSAAAYRDEAGRVLGAIACLGDMSERKHLEGFLLTATSREQRKLGSELHDGLGQQLTGLALLLRAATEKVRRGGRISVADLEAAAGLASSTIDTCRQIARGLSPLTQTDGSLSDGLSHLVRAMNQLGGPTFTVLDAASPLPPMDSGVADHLYRIAQEACTNALRHASAKHVTVGVSAANDRISLVVEDDGSGFSPVGGAHSGFGLKSMVYRANLIGAEIDVGSGNGSGTRVRCDYSLRPTIQA